MPLIKIVSLTKVYKPAGGVATEALRGIDMDVEEGAFAALAGPSGSGKTTLLNILGTLDRPTGGSVWFDGTDLGSLAHKALAEFRLTKIGFVFQSFNLFVTLSAVENIEYVMMLQGIQPGVRRWRAEELLTRVGLAGLGHKRPHQLSGGQQQRVAVARALASRPRLILADEPTANLDSRTALSLIALMRELNETEHTTFILSTHDRLVMEKAGTLFTLKDGKIAA